ncbi:MAG: ATP-binding protein [Clostridiales bacterium]|nr:ATP-binding protein [Clostridiales bacterium]
MGIYVNRGNSSFTSAKKSQIYVDKTGLLEYTNSVLGTEQRCICSSRPRRFGKSMAAGMIAAYYGKGCDSRKLFDDLKIAESADYEEYLNKYDVIHLDIAYMLMQLKDSLKTVLYVEECVIDELKTIYPGILSEKDNMLPFALSKIHNATGAEFVIIIDEWDAIFREDKYDKDAQEAYIALLRGLFKGVQSRDSIALAYITGILPIKKYNSESALNNFDEFTMAASDILAEYVGFTEKEVIALCKKYNMSFEEMQRWYDGYLLREDLHVYNPKSVVDAIRRKKIANYWTKTVAYEALQDYISMDFDGLKSSVVQMLTGERCRINRDTFENDMTNFKNRDDVLTVLIHLGYLAYDRDVGEVYIPNEEVRAAFANAIQGTDWTPVIQAIKQSDRLLSNTWNKDAETVAKGISEVHMANASILEYNDENALSCVISLAYYNAINEYTLIRELPSGKGYADIAFLPRRSSDKPAMIVELKYNKSAEGAIEQIKAKEYVQALEEYKGNLLLVGINYDKETKEHSCVIEEWEWR